MTETRFAYIDSQGNEVPIPSVDALALRIELGAIGPDTELYDAQADRWGPAHTHEIFHTLQREKEEGFVAPPPPVVPPSAGEPREEAPVEAAPPEDMIAADSAVEAEEVPTAGEEEAPEEGLEMDVGALAPDEPPAPPSQDLGFDLTLTEPAVEGGEEAAGAEDLTVSGIEDLGPAVPEEASPAPQEESSAFDFGGLESLELEAEVFEEEAAGTEPPLGSDEGPGVTPLQEGAAEPDAMDFGGGMQLEEPLAGEMDFSPPQGDVGGGMELEQPMSEFTAETPPAWMEQEGPSQAEEPEGAMSFGADEEAAAETPEGPPAAEEPARPRREPPQRKTRPSPPRRKRKRSLAGPVIGLVVLGAVGAGVWFGWSAWQSRKESREDAGQAQVLPPVTIPDIPAELLPTMRDLGEAALSAMVDSLEVLAAASGLPEAPRDDWLAGVYLANASRFPDVEEYWTAMESFVDMVRSNDTRLFHEEYVRQLAVAGVEGDTADMILERADSGFLATRDARFEAYAQMDDLINAALQLHQFLLDNEDQIQYEPAAGGMSRDPVLEAVPATSELGDRMWEMVGAITDALDALGTLDKVTTERLLAVLFDRIRRAGFE
ncbi:MAG: hypothetical protein ACE5GJ_00015 [Gemmatimonadota bacterium]